ncbi:MAG: hypothetical protein DRI46_07350, partial [Chloroflexi bacterium]
EFFRPDQPRLGSTDISYSRIVAGVMILAGIIWLLVKYEIITLPFLKPGPAAYQLSSKAQASKEE